MRSSRGSNHDKWSSALRRVGSGDVPRQRGAFTILELMIVLLLATILASVLITSAQSTVTSELQAAARTTAGELAYARSLAVSNNSSYRVTFDAAENRLVLTHVGTDTTLNTLPADPLRASDDPSNQRILDFDLLPNLSMGVVLLGAQAIGSTTQAAANIQFGPFGETTQADETVIWFASGVGKGRRYIAVRVNPITGLESIDDPQGSTPLGLNDPAAEGATSP